MLATVITSITIYIYSFELKILLFEKFNLHPFDRTNQDHQQKDYDVYLMYCDADFNLAVHTLLPGLERLGYRVFVPERDMGLGAVTAEARANALTRSHRAVVLVSQSFIDTQSSMTEFFHAHEHENSATRKRFLVLIKLREKINYKNYDIFKKYFSTNFFAFATVVFVIEPDPYSGLQSSPCTQKCLSVSILSLTCARSLLNLVFNMD